MMMIREQRTLSQRPVKKPHSNRQKKRTVDILKKKQSMSHTTIMEWNQTKLTMKQEERHFYDTTNAQQLGLFKIRPIQQMMR
jgi:hypothetical protein